MQIVIPMSGFGERFRRAGYTVPKPLIEVEGKPIIAHVIDMFPGETNFIFICNQEHLDEPSYAMEAVLKKYCPTGKVIGITPHKLGPINAVRQVEHLLNLNEPVVVNYCDFTCYWDWDHFKKFVLKTQCVGAIPAYKDFHPHTLGTTNYAYMREANGWVLDIQEKQPYTNNRMEEYASSGTYYFSSAKIMNDVFKEVMAQDLNIGGEYYVSLAYKLLFAAQMPVAVYPLQHFMQWGTPDDVDEYNMWSNIFKQLLVTDAQEAPIGSVIIPMAGLGQRFVNEGYTQTKPLIPVSGLPMVVQATHDLPTAKQYVFVLRADMLGYEQVSEELKNIYPNTIIKTVEQVTEGQACTAQTGLEALETQAKLVETPITFSACDNGVLYDDSVLQELLNDPEVDIIVWGIRGYPNAIRNPAMFGWINVHTENKIIHSISVKVPLDNSALDPIVLGTFTFRRAEDFHRTFSRLISENKRVNGEFYLDSMINEAIALGMRCVLFEVNSYLCWGTPNDLRTYEYWQSCFHKWPNHPYRLELDKRVPVDQVDILSKRFNVKIPKIPNSKRYQ